MDDRVVGTARLQENEEIDGKLEGQIRYLAIDEDYQNQKIGRLIISYIEWYAKGKKIAYIKINARKTAKGFFEKQGYEVVSEGHTLFNEIEHYIMKKEFEHKSFYF